VSDHLTREQVRQFVAEIRAAVNDPEDAHGREDDLYVAVLDAIAMGDTDDPKGIAYEALEARLINYPRFYA
jgi:hypothetical protein